VNAISIPIVALKLAPTVNSMKIWHNTKKDLKERGEQIPNTVLQ
jgi:hypothetical protein